MASLNAQATWGVSIVAAWGWGELDALLFRVARCHNSSSSIRTPCPAPEGANVESWISAENHKGKNRILRESVNGFCMTHTSLSLRSERCGRSARGWFVGPVDVVWAVE
jgi:hypothetical protein